MANKRAVYSTDDDESGHPLLLDGTEVIVHVARDSRSLVLYYSPVCDPELFIEFSAVPSLPTPVSDG